MEEIWKKIEGHEDSYEVSNKGQVRSFKSGKAKILKQALDGFGYPMVCLSKDNYHKNYKVHRLVAQAFIPNPDNKPTIDHINRNKTDNRVENLRWYTYSEQQFNTSRSDRKPVLQIDINNNIINEFESSFEAERQTGVKNQHIFRVCHGLRKHAGGFKWRYKEDQ